MIQRVRAILITPDDKLLLIKRIKPGIAPYWVLPGGRVEDHDEDLEAALAREVTEEMAGTPYVRVLIYTMEGEQSRESFYLARIDTWSFDDHTGPEFSEKGRGEYLLEEVPLATEALEALDIKPTEVADFLRNAAHETGSPGLFNLPDLRHAEPARYPDLHTVGLETERE